MKRISVRKDSYYDSVFLMLAAREIQSMEGVAQAVVAMATPMNVELLVDSGFDAKALKALTPNDLVIAIDAADEATLERAAAEAMEALKRKKTAKAEAGLPRAGSMDSALKLEPGANLAIVSVPGTYAARQAMKALEAGLHVMLFSDNVALDDEIALKKLAVKKGLLLMGPDCGTSIINGKPLCFANAVRRGPVGLVAASGTGLQEVTCLLERFGAGVSQAIGTGGRDLKNPKVGGMTSLMAIKALAADEATKVLVVISKPPAKEVASKVVAALNASGKPSVAFFLGAAPRKDTARVAFASDLEETAALAAAMAAGAATPAEARARLASEPAGDTLSRPDKAAIRAVAAREAAKLSSKQRYLRGLFTGGTLADEALFMAHAALGGVRSNNQTDEAWLLKDPRKSKGHSIVDLGDDVFTAGKPHPMIDPAARAERIEREGADPETAVMLLDLVLGYGSHADPAGAAAPAIRAAKAAAAERKGYLPVVASITGTSGDPQGLDRQRSSLAAEGVIVEESNFRAALLATEIARLAAGGSK